MTAASVAFVADVSAPVRTQRGTFGGMPARRPRDRDLSILGVAPGSVERVR